MSVLLIAPETLQKDIPSIQGEALTLDAEVIHLDNGWDWSVQQWFYSSVLEQGPLAAADFDMMGVSFYPVSSATVDKTLLNATN